MASFNSKVRTDSSTEFGSNPVLILQIRTGLDRSVDFNERVTAFTTGTACTPNSDIKGRIRPMCMDIENQQHWSLLEHRRRQITDVDVVKNRIRRHRYQWRRCSVAAARRQRRATTHGVLYTRTTPVAAARAELGGRIAAARPSRQRGVVSVGGLAR